LTAAEAGDTVDGAMPMYEYRCTKCRKRFGRQEAIAEHGRRRPACPKCKSRAVEQVYSAFFAKTGRKS
jgi:putative FmdB family regulatory protein